MELNPIASFIIRISLAKSDGSCSKEVWRIKVTHVQQESEILFQSMEDAVNYMKTITGVS
jgi:hypothetical protein